MHHVPCSSVREAQLVGRTLNEMLSGPAAIDAGGRGKHDWLLLGHGEHHEEHFHAVHAEWRRLLAPLPAMPGSPTEM